jgi:alpha-tubulin suppressor-like RCC1 family protein
MTTCGVAADGTWCWGNNAVTSGVTVNAPVKVSSTRFVAIATKILEMCGLTSVGEVYCWTPTGTSQPPSLTLVSGNIPFSTLSGSYNHLCGLTSSGDAYCWGENTHGELAVGDTLPRDTPTRVASTLRFVRIAAGVSRTCAIATDRHTYCSGATDWTWSRQPDDSLNSIRFVAVPGADDFVSVTVGGGVACGITINLAAKCWGSNYNGLLGVGGLGGSTATPAPITGGHVFTSIVAGTYHVCGVTVESELYCWGLDHAGQLGSVGFPVACTLSDEFYSCTGTPVLVPKPQS